MMLFFCFLFFFSNEEVEHLQNSHSARNMSKALDAEVHDLTSNYCSSHVENGNDHLSNTKLLERPGGCHLQSDQNKFFLDLTFSFSKMSEKLHTPVFFHPLGLIMQSYINHL